MESAAIQVGGLMADFLRTGGTGASKRLRKLAKAAGLAAWSAWATGEAKNPGGTLPDRFKATAFEKFDFRRRSERYERRQRRLFGRPLPYRAPRRGGNHMADLVRRPGGYAARGVVTPTETRIDLTLPGARVLNLLAKRKGNTLPYRDQFLDLDHTVEGNAIAMDAINRLMDDLLKATA